MARRKAPTTKVDPSAFDSAGANVYDNPVKTEIEDSYLEYAYSVIHSRGGGPPRAGAPPARPRARAPPRAGGGLRGGAPPLSFSSRRRGGPAPPGVRGPPGGAGRPPGVD